MSTEIADRVPKNTTIMTTWAHSVWGTWCKACNIQKLVAKWAWKEWMNICHTSYLRLDVRMETPTHLKHCTMQLMCGLQRFLRENGRPEVTFLMKSSLFDRSRKALDARMKRLTMQGVGTATRISEPLTAEQEIFLWDKGVFSIHSAEGLINAVFWYNCKCFGLRGGDEHCTLVLEQYSIGLDSVGRYLQFNERSCKNVQSGLKQRNVQTKISRFTQSQSLESGVL